MPLLKILMQENQSEKMPKPLQGFGIFYLLLLYNSRNLKISADDYSNRFMLR